MPTPAEQLEFLQKLQRLFDEADFTATYKFALLMSLSDLAVESGREDGSDLALTMPQIAEKFIEYYWPQTAPYSSGRSGTRPGVLSQNLGEQAAVVNELSDLRAAGVKTLREAKSNPSWRTHVGNIARTIRKMPLSKLQNVGGETDAFLYELPEGRNPLILRAAVLHCLRQFHGIIHRSAKSAWLEHVRDNRRNLGAVGLGDDLEEFMFGSQRRDLSKVMEVLQEYQAGNCFYCNGALRGRGDVDHFIAWSRYPRDTAHNFVLAHASCNRQKGDRLAAKGHLERWLGRNSTNGSELAEAIAALGFSSSLDASTRIALWAYEQGVVAHAHGWVLGNSLEIVDRGYLECFGAGPSDW